MENRMMGNYMRHLLPIFALVMLLASCQSSPIRQFGKIEKGMEKADVLQIMGTPWTSTRLHGKDRWIYIIYEDKVRMEKEVHFQNGAVVYVGDTWLPAPEKQAVAIDQQKEELEKQFKEEAERVKKEKKNAYSNYEENIKGTGDKVLYMPEYEEIK